MMPVYRYMDSHPFHGNQVPSFSQNYHPSFEAVPSRTMVVDPSNPPPYHEPYPCPNYFGYAAPHHACCNHNNFPAYYGLCPHIVLPQHACCGQRYPPYPKAVPVQYVPASPPHYLMEQSRDEYEKDVPRSDYHCCGCPNHAHNPKNDRGVKIEEHEPEAEKSGRNPTVPPLLKDCPYPIIWIPPDYMWNNKQGKPWESEKVNKVKPLEEAKPSKSTKPSNQEPSAWSGWPAVRGEDGKKSKDGPNDDRMSQLPFPIIWMPSYNEANHENRGEKDATGKPADESPNVKFFPLKFLDGGGDSMNRPQAVQENSGALMDSEIVKERGVGHKSVPVKQVEAPKEMVKSEETEKRGNSVPSMDMGHNNEASEAASATSAKRRASSPTKESKLPPVCLRVDPLPRKKNGDAKSRSPSPPGLKGLAPETSRDNSKFSASSDAEVKAHEDPGIATISNKQVQVMEKEDKENKGEEEKHGVQPQIPVVLPVDSQKKASGSHDVEDPGKDGDKCLVEEDEKPRKGGVWMAEEVTKTVEETDGERKAEQKKLSDEEAALLIQSAYRGFQVRRWEPLKKLKQMAKVREQVADIRNRIHVLQSSSDPQRDDKQRVVIGEMIMGLLLKLDTIQGLHPGLRDIRRSLAKELTSLQEKLDSICAKKLEELDCSNLMSMEEKQSREAGQQADDLFQSVDDMCDTMADETLPLPLIREELQISESDVRGSLVTSDLKSSVAEPDPGNGEFQNTEAIMTVNQHGTEEYSIQLPSEESKSEVRSGNQDEVTCCIREDQSAVTEVSDPQHVEANPVVCDLKELPQEVTDEELALSKDERTVTGPEAVIHGKDEGLNAAPMAVVIAGDEATAEKTEDNTMAELPAEVMYEDKKMPESVVLQGGDGGQNVATDASLPLIAYDELATAEKSPKLSTLSDFPVGVINEEEPEKGMNSEVLPQGNMEQKGTISASSPSVEVPILNESEQQPIEVLNEDLSLAEVNDMEKVGPQRSGGISVEDAVIHVDMQQQEESGNQNNVPSEVGGSEEMPHYDEVHDGHDQSIIDIGCNFTSEAISESKERQTGEDRDTEGPLIGNGGKEGKVQEHNEQDDQELVTCSGQIEYQPVAGEEGFDDRQFTPVSVKHDEVGKELLPASSTATQQSIGEHAVEMESDRKLVEENQKLREMMEKLIEAGKEQLTVISNLTGRVKELEKKLSGKTKTRARRCRTPLSPPSQGRLSNESLKKAVGVAM